MRSEERGHGHCRSPPRAVQRRQHDPAKVKAAIEDIQVNGMSRRAAAKKYGIPEATLRHKMSGYRGMDSKPGPKSLLTETEETVLVNYIKLASKRALPVTKDSVVSAVTNILEEDRHLGIIRKKPPSFTGPEPKRKWWQLFCKRHPEFTFSSDYSKLVAAAAQKGNPSTIFEGEDQGGYAEVSCQTVPPPTTNQYSQTSPVLSVTTANQRLHDFKFEGSMCDMVIDYAGYALLREQYVKVPFIAKGPPREFVRAVPNTLTTPGSDYLGPSSSGVPTVAGTPPEEAMPRSLSPGIRHSPMSM